MKLPVDVRRPAGHRQPEKSRSAAWRWGETAGFETYDPLTPRPARWSDGGGAATERPDWLRSGPVGFRRLLLYRRIRTSYHYSALALAVHARVRGCWSPLLALTRRDSAPDGLVDTLLVAHPCAPGTPGHPAAFVRARSTKGARTQQGSRHTAFAVARTSPRLPKWALNGYELARCLGRPPGLRSAAQALLGIRLVVFLRSWPLDRLDLWG